MKTVTSRAKRLLYTTPDSLAAEPIIALINRARHTVHMAIYALTLHAVTDALIAARARGVDVILLLDAGQALGATERGQLSRLLHADVECVVDTHRIVHDKYFIVDGRWSVSGSMNFSGSGLRSEHNHYWLDHSRNVAQALEADFQSIYQEAKR